MLEWYKMLTLFTTTKSFENKHIRIIQTNALNSWCSLNPRPEIILFGSEKGSDVISKELGIINVPDIRCNEFNTPYIDDIFKQAENLASNKILCYINADIILMQEIIEIITLVSKRFRDFLIVGQRWDLDINTIIDYSGNWQNVLKKLIMEKGIIHPSCGIDLFIFKKNSIKNMPSLLVGRPGWDNWLVYYFIKSGIPVIDATKQISIIHQNHHYKHINYGNGISYEGVEAEKNRETIKNSPILDISDATYIIKNNEVTSKSFIKNRRYFQLKYLLKTVIK